MDNKTPPLWASLSAIEICGKYHEPDYSVNDMATDIASHAPDAEALAEALGGIETLYAEYVALGPSANSLAFDHVQSSVREARATLSAYRARFPKVEVTP